MKYNFLYLFFLFFSLKSFSQYKQMLHKPYKSKVEDIDVLYRNTINKGTKDSLFIKRYTKQMEAFALKNNDKELALEANLLNAYAFWFIFGHQNPDLIFRLIEVVQKGKKEQVSHIEERASYAVAKHYWAIKKYEKSFEWSLRSAKLLENIKQENYPNMAEHLNFIGYCYYYFKDFSNALTYYKKSSQLNKTSFNSNDVIDAQNSLGLCYQKLGQLNLSNQLFLKIIEDTTKYQNDIWKKIASGNLGFNYYLEKRYDKAIPLFIKDIQNAKQIEEIGLAAGSAIPLADIYLQKNRLDKAKEYIKGAKEYIEKSGQTDRLKDLYPVMSKWYAANNSMDSSVMYLDSSMITITKYNQKYNTIKLLRANQKVEAKERQIEVQRLQAESLLKVSQRNYIILTITLLLIGSLFVYWFRNKYHLKNQEIKELRIEKSETALTHAKNQLQDLKMKIHDEQEVIESLQQQLQSKDDKKIVNELKSKTILTNDDWDKYQSLFDEAYPNFLSTLKTHEMNITPSELRCLCLEKLQLSNTEMALALGISTNSIVVTKHRIRKKLNLKNQQELQMFVRKIS